MTKPLPGFGLMVAGAVVVALATTVGGATNEVPLRALMITGGCCHDYLSQKTILAQGISARAPVTWTVVHEGGTSRDHPVSVYTIAGWAAGYDVVVHNECFGGVTDSAFVEGIAAAHAGGVPAVMLHCAIHSYRNASTDEWRECLGISSYSHETLRDFWITNTAPGHPIMRGFPREWLDPADELYKVTLAWPNTVPLAQAYGVETRTNHVVIWANTYGQGRVFGTTLGHGNGTMQTGMYLDLVTRGLLWACGRLDDATTFRVIPVRHDAGHLFLEWPSAPGWRYLAEAAPGVAGPWAPVPGGTVTATNTVAGLRLVTDGDAARFVRVQLLE